MRLHKTLIITFGIIVLSCNNKNDTHSTKEAYKKTDITNVDTLFIGDNLYPEDLLPYHSLEFFRYLSNDIFARKGILSSKYRMKE